MEHQCVVDSHAPLTGDLASNPGMCPDWELNQQTFGSWAGTQSTEPHQPGLIIKIFIKLCLFILHEIFKSVKVYNDAPNQDQIKSYSLYSVGESG